MPCELRIGDRLLQKLEDFGERLIQVDPLGLVQVLGSPGDDAANDRIIRHTREVLVVRVEGKSFRR